MRIRKLLFLIKSFYIKLAYDFGGCLERPERTLGFLVHDVAHLLRKRFEQNARGLGLTRSQWHALAHLVRNEGIQQGALADLMEIEPISLTRIVDRLQHSGLVQRRPDPRDRRVWRLYLTPRAAPMLDAMKEIGALTRQEALVGIGKVDHNRLMRILTQMKANLAGVLEHPAAERKVSHG